MPSKQPPAFAHASFHGRLGIARVDITPPVGVYSRNWGAAKHDVADSIHRPLTLTALTLNSLSGGRGLVFLDADLGWWKTPQTFRHFQRRLLDELELEPAQLIFALTHTHAGPPLMEADPSLPGSDLLQRWQETLVPLAVEAVREAQAATFEGTLDWHLGRCGLAKVRDLPDPTPDATRVLCGYSPQGEPDDTLLLGRISDRSGVTRGTLVNYACHPTTLAADNTAISPDYIGAMRETMQQVTGAPALFMLGACGDLAPRYQYVGDPRVADQHGRQLGYAALATLSDMEPVGAQLAYSGVLESGAPLAMWRHQPCSASQTLDAVQYVVELPLKDWPSAEELERQRLACTDRALEERLRRRRDIRRGLGDGRSFEMPLYAWRLGDAVLVGTCCEPYSRMQRELRRRFAGQTIICMNVINGSLGYLPPADLYDTDVYPVWQTPFDRGCLEITIEAMSGVIKNVLSRE
ncbi:MAG: alkaline ceramidase [Planctomycetales bacterium]|nr:alkaline ceramidase [Planctomycetales bacterium]